MEPFWLMWNVIVIRRERVIKGGKLKVDSDRFTTSISKVLVFIDLLLKYRFIVFTFMLVQIQKQSLSMRENKSIVE